MRPFLKPSDGFEYYTDDAIYWNAFERVRDGMSAAVSGDAGTGWVAHVKARYGARGTGLFISCGNGWVERDCFNAGLIRNCVGFDIMESSLAAARQNAALIGLQADYVLADGNRLALDRTSYGIAVNHGAMHHIAYLDRLLRQLHGWLAGGGIYVINDYTGAHRNQYDWETWSAVVQANHALPPPYRARLGYAHMPTMLARDPTEAIHSELQMDLTRRYFDVREEVQYGGAIAYTLLYSNRALYRDRATEAGARVVEHILALDAAFLKARPDSNLFTFAVCLPKPALPPQPMLDLWTAAENERELHASRNGGRYYPPTALELMYNQMLELHGR